MSAETSGFRLCLIDGTFELFRAFYGAPSQVSSQGREIGATRALCRSLLSLTRSGEFSHFAVAFDTVIESFRNELFEGYKTGEGIDPDLFSQFPLVERATRELGFVVLSMVQFEADDGLATLAAEHSENPAVAEIVIASPDKDLRQCVRDGGQGHCPISTWDRIRDVRYDVSKVIAKMGVQPVSVPDYLALVGDTADGIPGVPRWGARSSAQVLNHYGHLEKIPRDADAWTVNVRGKRALVEQLVAHEDEVLLYRRLATLRTDVPHGFSLEDLRLQGDLDEAWQGVDAFLRTVGTETE